MGFRLLCCTLSKSVSFINSWSEICQPSTLVYFGKGINWNNNSAVISITAFRLSAGCRFKRLSQSVGLRYPNTDCISRFPGLGPVALWTRGGCLPCPPRTRIQNTNGLNSRLHVRGQGYCRNNGTLGFKTLGQYSAFHHS